MGENKVFRDPIYQLITFNKNEDKDVIKIIDSKEFQRLKRIRQLGLSNYTFPTATHDRFSHSIGVAYIVGQLVNNLHIDSEEVKVHIDDNPEIVKLYKEQIKTLLQITALLHDIGHGPFSHAFEKITKVNHEDMSDRILNDPNGDIYKILSELEDDTLRKYGKIWITEILKGTFRPIWIKELISSQFDADRMDYLLRDAYMCGVIYASFDWNWLFHNIQIDEIKSENRKGLIIDATKGIHAVESFIISRYHMYEQVYFHKTTRGFEVLIRKIFERVKWLLDKNTSNLQNLLNENLKCFLNNPNSLSDFQVLDDFLIFTEVNKFQLNSDDKILKALCNDFIFRKPFKNIKESDSNRLFERIDESTIESELGDEEFKYYYFEDDYKNIAYKDSYLLGNTTSEYAEHIWLKTKKGQVELSAVSPLIGALKNKNFSKYRAYIKRDYIDKTEILKLLKE